MCLVLFNHDEHPVYPLIVAANRDEFYDRPTERAGWWEDMPGILAGRDLRSGGTWLGMSASGRFSALTNVRAPGSRPPEGAKSRGGLVTSVLSDERPLPGVLDALMRQSGNYDMYNLIAGTPGRLFYGTNRDAKSFIEISPGTHGLSNGRLDTPWPKVEAGKEWLARAASGYCPIDPDELFSILAEAEPFPDRLLPDTGVGPDMERILSPLFIKTGGYGTRCSTVILMDRDGIVTFIERTFMDGRTDGEQRFQFQIK
ncbi:NRDE family protein [Edaphobacillus lindanitolerans]|nr:NRDE family protein [Edaphobacillus lindanitolerans]